MREKPRARGKELGEAGMGGTGAQGKADRAPRAKKTGLASMREGGREQIGRKTGRGPGAGNRGRRRGGGGGL